MADFEQQCAQAEKERMEDVANAAPKGKGEFNLPYVFKVDGKEVVIQNKAGGDFDKFLRVKPGDLGKPDSQGGQGKFARFIVEFEDGDSYRIRLKSKESGKYLRIMEDGEINIEGGTGPLTLFKVHVQGQANLVKLESNKFEGSLVRSYCL